MHTYTLAHTATQASIESAPKAVRHMKREKRHTKKTSDLISATSGANLASNPPPPSGARRGRSGARTSSCITFTMGRKDEDVGNEGGGEEGCSCPLLCLPLWLSQMRRPESNTRPTSHSGSFIFVRWHCHRVPNGTDIYQVGEDRGTQREKVGLKLY